MRDKINKMEKQNKSQQTRIRNLDAKNKDLHKNLTMNKKQAITTECQSCYKKQQQINLIQSKLIIANKSSKKLCEENNHLTHMIEQYNSLKCQHEGIINKLEQKIQAISVTKNQLKQNEKNLNEMVYNLKEQIQHLKQTLKQTK